MNRGTAKRLFPIVCNRVSGNPELSEMVYLEGDTFEICGQKESKSYGFEFDVRKIVNEQVIKK